MKDPIIELEDPNTKECLRFILESDGTLRFEAESESTYGIIGFDLDGKLKQGLIAWFIELAGEQ